MVINVVHCDICHRILKRPRLGCNLGAGLKISTPGHIEDSEYPEHDYRIECICDKCTNELIKLINNFRRGKMNGTI